MNNFLGGNYSYQKDMKGYNPNTSNNLMVNPSPGYYRGPNMMRDQRDFNVPPMVFSRDHTPDLKHPSIFSFENTRSPNIMPQFISSPYRRPESDFVYNTNSPNRNEFFKQQSNFSPAFNFNNDSSMYRGRPNNHVFQFQPLNQDSVGKTPDGNPFFGVSGQQSTSSKMKGFFFNFDNKPFGNNVNSAFNTPAPMNDKK